MSDDQPPAYVNDATLAQRFGVNKATIWNWVRRNGFPKPIKLSPQITRWRLEDVQAWEAARQ